jgi:hypothetical protein
MMDEKAFEQVSPSFFSLPLANQHFTTALYSPLTTH